MRFIGRENELEALIRRYDGSKAELFIVTFQDLTPIYFDLNVP